jgi:cell division protein FtsL
VAPARARAPRRSAHRRLTGGIVWIAVFAVLLTGVVAVNVAVLRLNMNVSRLDKQELQLRAENQALASQVSSAASASRIESTAHKLGLVPAPAIDTSYLELGRK